MQFSDLLGTPAGSWGKNRNLQCSSVQQCTAEWSRVPSSALQCSSVQWCAVECSTVLSWELQCSLVQWCDVKCSRIRSSALQCSLVQWYNVECSSILSIALQCSLVQWCTVDCWLQCSAVQQQGFLAPSGSYWWIAGWSSHDKHFMYSTVLECNVHHSIAL